MANMKLNLFAMDESIIQLIRDNAYITVPEIAEQVGKAQATVYRHIITLTDAKMLERIGSRKKGYWKLSD